MSTNYRFSIVVILAFFGMATQYAGNAYAATNDKLDVNLSVIYLGTKSQKDSNTLSEAIVQFPFPLSEHARDTGQGAFGGITYYDNKSLVSDPTQLVSEFGIGRVYYSYSVPGDTPYTFVPFVTFYREFWYSFKDTTGKNSEVKGRSYLLPGVLYTYRFNERVAFHFDSEVYSYVEMNNNRSRIGFSYSLAWPWILSASFERNAWDIDSDAASVDGVSREASFKVIFRDPPQGNFALVVGYGDAYRDSFGTSLQYFGETRSKGTYFGIEASGGVLAW